MGCSNVSGHNRPQNIKVDFKQEMTDVGKVDEVRHEQSYNQILIHF